MRRNTRDWLSVVITAIFLFGAIWFCFGSDFASWLFSISQYPALIIAGLIALAIGLKRKYWGILFGIIVILFALCDLY